ncbi:MAG TPA: GNAT family N-acetyltransferase [Clostridia bacterium]|nr:GNAT family N-acetyltransferase [Clostridia bacterium]
MHLEIIDGETRIDDVKTLFAEYAASLGIDLSYQNFGDEFAGLPGKYARPSGRLYLALVNGAPAGCVAMRKLDTARAEMKRLYVREGFRGAKVGLALTERIIADAREIGCRALVLDTLSTMHRAQALYRSLGFVEIEPYYDSPIHGTTYLSLTL